MQATTESDGYVLARTEAEYQRLRLQAKAWEPATRALLADAGIAEGMRCLDAGCGPGEAMRLIGRMVGPTGHVTGLDIDAALGAHMLAELHREEGPNFAFVSADLMRGDPVPGAPFDLVYARLLLLHMTDPVGAVRRLASLLRPGGRLVLVEFRGEDPEVPIKPEHKMTLKQVRRELEPQGFRFQKSLEFLPWQHVIIFEKPKPDESPKPEADKPAAESAAQ